MISFQIFAGNYSMQDERNNRIFKSSTLEILEDNNWEVNKRSADDLWKGYINETGEDFVQDIWEAVFIVYVSKTIGGDKEQTWAEIRSIPGVTIVTPFGRSREDREGTVVHLRVKFCCIAQAELTPRLYVKKVLRNQMKTIPGLSVNKLLRVSKLN
jgi:hypothetical protein|tara:strand:- start:6279 stop:6746 length:468 start_codon:yes stop_codon:yes gene_type:complete